MKKKKTKKKQVKVKSEQQCQFTRHVVGRILPSTQHTFKKI